MSHQNQENGQSEQLDAEEKVAEHPDPQGEAGQEQGATNQPDQVEVGGDAPDEPSGDLPLEEVVAGLQADLAEARESALRAQAEAQNIKRRAEQDVEKARKFALEGFTKELIVVVDNLERALEAAGQCDETATPFVEGVELTLKSFRDVMQKFNVEQVDPVGEPFDPNLHQAMSMVENPEVEPNTVLTVIQKGYTLNGRLVRPAMVMVSKNGA